MKRQEELNEAWCKYMNKCSTEIMQALAFALRWCDEHPNWISVDEELPPTSDKDDESDDYLIVDSYGDKNVGYYNKMDELWFSCDGHILDVTHWMPMLEAPHHIIDANKKVDRVIGTADHIKTALDVLNKKGDEK